jgi:hypothetical protein
MIHFSIARILLAIYDPRNPRIGPQKRQAEEKVNVCFFCSLSMKVAFGITGVI